jgi:hypothetical protein
MYTVEFDHDEVIITILDDSGSLPDLIINSYEDGVYITQMDEDGDYDDILNITPEMWQELILAINSSEGAYVIKR